jgi:hypothetical protein
MIHNEVIAVQQRHADVIYPLQRDGLEPGALFTEAVTVRYERELRNFCCRIFGWDDARKHLVDDVTQKLLAAVGQGAAIALRGESDLVPVAHALHRRLLGPERPFIVCDPRRCEGAGSVRSPPNFRNGLEALLAGTGGSICIRACRLPADFDALSEALRGPGPTAQVFVCLSNRDRIRDMLSPPVEVPSLHHRAADLDRLISEYLDDATRELGVGRMRFSSVTPDSVLRGITSFSELERVILRLVALKSTRNMSQAACRLRVAPVSLSRWVLRRRTTAVLRDVACLEYEDDAEETTDAGSQLDAISTDNFDGERRPPIEAVHRSLAGNSGDVHGKTSHARGDAAPSNDRVGRRPRNAHHAARRLRAAAPRSDRA